MLRPTEALRRYPGFLMFWIGRHSSARFAAALEPIGLQPRDFGLLNVLHNAGPASQQALGQTIGIDPSTMVAILDDLEQRALVERRRNAADRRAYEVHLTADGKAALRRGRRVAGRMQHELFAGLEPAEREELTRLLGKVAAAIEREA
jgi:DNA-binding MarR family transcriptional regulator